MTHSHRLAARYLVKRVFVLFLIFALPWPAWAADSRLVTNITVISSAPYMQSIAGAMHDSLVNSRFVRPVSLPGPDVKFVVLVDGRAVSGSDGLLGSVVVISTVRCPNESQIYVGHRVGVCGGLYLDECGAALATSVEEHAQMASNYLRSSASCHLPR